MPVTQNLQVSKVDDTHLNVNTDLMLILQKATFLA